MGRTKHRPWANQRHRKSGNRNFGAVSVGELFLFKLHAPDDFIVGGGVFGHASNVPLSLAWEAFGTKNGVPSLAEMRRRIARYRRDDTLLDPRIDPSIGCRILTQPFFWPREGWLPVPAGFARNIVTGKRYDTDAGEGRYLWDAVADRAGLIENNLVGPGLADIALAPAERYGASQTVRPRLGQGAFRLAATDAYERRCAVSGEKTLSILDAAHIRSYGEGGAHDPANGLLLRTDIHRLFDLGYVTVSDDRRFEVSHRLKADSTMAGTITICMAPRSARHSGAMPRQRLMRSPGTASIATSDEQRRPPRRRDAPGRYRRAEPASCRASAR